MCSIRRIPASGNGSVRPRVHFSFDSTASSPRAGQGSARLGEAKTTESVQQRGFFHAAGQLDVSIFSRLRLHFVSCFVCLLIFCSFSVVFFDFFGEKKRWTS